MPNIPSELKQRITSSDPQEREAAAGELGNYTGSVPLRHLIGMLSDESPQVVFTAVRSLVSIGSQEVVEEIIPLLRSDDARLRNHAIEIIYKIGPDVLPQVIALVNDSDRDVRKFAVDILKMMRAPKAEDTIIRAVFDEDINVATAAAEALSSVGTQRAIPHLIECLGREPWLKYVALKALGEIGGEDALKAILATDPEEESIVLYHAVTALGTIGDSRGLDFLIKLLEKKDPAIVPSVIQATERILKSADDNTIETTKRKIPISEIMACLKSDNANVMRSVIGLLGLLRDETAIEELARLYNESNEHLFEELEEAFIRIRSDKVEPFIEIIENQMEPETVKIAAVRLLKRLGNKEAFNPLVTCLKTAPDNLKVEIIRALAPLKDKRILAILHGLLEEKQAEIRETAIEALETFRDNSSIPFLIRLLTEASESIRSMAATSLRTYNLEDYKEDIFGLLRASRPEIVSFGIDVVPEALSHEFEKDILGLCHHKDQSVRKRAVERCSSFKDDMAFETVASSLNDEIPQVRLVGIRGLGNYPDREVGTMLLNAVSSDPEIWNRYEAVNIIGQLRLLNVVPRIVSLLESAPDLVKVGILDVLGELGDRKYTEIVKKYIGSENEQVKEAAVEALERLGIDD